jgi:hypothetical protein
VRGAEESPLLETVTSSEDREDMAHASHLYSVAISSSAVFTCSSEWHVEVVNKSAHQSKPGLQPPQYRNNMRSLCGSVIPYYPTIFPFKHQQINIKNK